MVSGSAIPVPDMAIELLTDKAHLSLSSFVEKRSSPRFPQTLSDALNLCLKVLFRKETHSKSNAIDYEDTSKAVDDVIKKRPCEDCVRGSGLSLREKALFEVWDR